jgi:FkbM family methyltransferase
MSKAKYHSQNDEERVILEYFKDFKGTFCDIGANDGVTLSNTYALALQGWNGVYVEASPKAYARLYENIKLNAQVFPNAVGKEFGKLKFNESGQQLGVGDTSLVSTFHQSEMDRFKKSVRYQTITVSCVTWDHIIDNAKYKPFDFISMDIEGCELEVLPQMDLSAVELFCIEWNSRPDLKKAYDPYFEGFKVIYTSPENLIYAR